MKRLTPTGLALCVLIAVGAMWTPSQHAAPTLRIASKKFTESVILGEMLRQIARSQSIPASHLSELGGTRLVFDALRSGEVDAYVEYTGTIRQEILAGVEPDRPWRARLQEMGIEATEPLGFDNTYALGMTRQRAAELGVAAISDLQRFPTLRFGFGNEFMHRADGWPGVRSAYALPQQAVRGLDHDLAYRQIAAGQIDVMDVYATDANVARYDLVILQDDRDYFPDYQAVCLYRAELVERLPPFVAGIQQLAGAITDRQMVQLNEQVESGDANEAAAAAAFLQAELGIQPPLSKPPPLVLRIWRRTVEHLNLVRGSLIPAILLGIPLGICAHRFYRLGAVILAFTGLVQTIPSLALLVMLMPVAAAFGLSSVGTGSQTALLALFAYSLLPIVRNTLTGLAGIPRATRESAEVLGLSRSSQLLEIEVPLAAPTIVAGIKTAAILNIGFAALGAVIGAGGYGQPILTGIRLNNTALILEGALPAAGMAILAQGLFALAERCVIPRGLRTTATGA